MRIIVPVFLLLLLILLFRDKYPKPPTDIAGWNGAYGAQYPDIGDYEDLSKRGINLVVNNIMTEPGEWEMFYSAVVEHNLDMIPVLWGEDQTAWVWNDVAEEWELDYQRYPNSAGAQFLQFLREHPVYLKHTFALYAFHEPFNPENAQQISPQKIRKFWLQIHEEEFPQQKLMIYGESVSWNHLCANGCVDFDAIDLYNFTKCGLGRLGRYRIIEAVSSIDGLLIRPGACTLSQRRAVKAGKMLIDALYGFSEHSPPAPDGSRTRFFALIQTFAQQGSGMSYRMPRADEMYIWSTQIVQPQGNKLAGMLWYVFRFKGLYDQTLGNDRYDDSGKDRWKTISEVADVLY